MIAALFPASLLVAAVAAARGTWSPCGLSMVSAINPFSERSRGNRYWLTAVWFVGGALAGGAGLGAGAAVLAWALRPLHHVPQLALGLAAAGCLVALAADRRVAGFHLPLHPRQVNELWLMRYRRWIYAAGFGAQIGLGFATYIMTAATYLVVALAALTGSPGQALIAGLAFGLVRGAAVLLSSRCRSAGQLRGLHRGLSRLEPVSLRVVVAVEALVAAACGWVAFGPAGGLGVLAAGTVLAATPRLATVRLGSRNSELAGV